MLLKKQLLDYIGLKLAHLKACVATLNEIRFFDLNVASEDFFASLLNAVYGYSLANLNHDTLNEAAVDLGDKAQRLAVQITSERTKGKIQNTVDKFAERGLGTDYDTLKVLIIGDRTGDYPTLTVPSGVTFSGKTDVIDIPQLMKDISLLGVDDLQRVADLIRNEIRDVSTVSQAAANEARRAVDSTTPPNQKEGGKLTIRFDPNRDITTQKHSVGYQHDEIIKVVRICVHNNGNSTVKNCRAFVTQIDRVETPTTVFTVLHDARCLNWENQRDGFEPIDLNPGIDFRADLVVAEKDTAQALGSATNTNAYIPVFGGASWPSVLRVVSRPPCFFRYAGQWIFTVRVGSDSAATETLRLKVSWDGTLNGLSAHLVD